MERKEEPRLVIASVMISRDCYGIATFPYSGPFLEVFPLTVNHGGLFAVVHENTGPSSGFAALAFHAFAPFHVFVNKLSAVNLVSDHVPSSSLFAVCFSDVMFFEESQRTQPALPVMLAVLFNELERQMDVVW